MFDFQAQKNQIDQKSKHKMIMLGYKYVVTFENMPTQYFKTASGAVDWLRVNAKNAPGAMWSLKPNK